MQHIARKRTHNIDGFIVDPGTGQVLGSYTTHALAPVAYDYKLPTQVGKTQALRLYFELDPAPRPDVTEIEVESLPDGVIDLDAQRAKRGPKPKVKSNQIASLLKVAHAEHRGWMDDYVFGGCATAGGVSNGKLNVSPSHVLRACLLDEISVEVVKRVIRLDGLRTMSDQQARRVCQCARFAIGGMELYLERNPTVRQQLQFEVDFADSYYGDQADALKVIGGDVPVPVVSAVPASKVHEYPKSITALYKAGDYLAYGEALRNFRQGLIGVELRSDKREREANATLG